MKRQFTRHWIHLQPLLFSDIVATFVKTGVDIMNTRLQQFLGAENISQSQFADELGVARASVSHILAGRNKPGFDFLTSLMARFPRLNMEWLLAGKGKMYKDSPSTNPTIGSITSDSIESIKDVDEDNSDTLFSNMPLPAPSEVGQNSSEPEAPVPTQHPENQRKISKIIILYDDNSFTEIA